MGTYLLFMRKGVISWMKKGMRSVDERKRSKWQKNREALYYAFWKCGKIY